MSKRFHPFLPIRIRICDYYTNGIFFYRFNTAKWIIPQISAILADIPSSINKVRFRFLLRSAVAVLDCIRIALYRLRIICSSKKAAHPT